MSRNATNRLIRHRAPLVHTPIHYPGASRVGFSEIAHPQLLEGVPRPLLWYERGRGDGVWYDESVNANNANGPGGAGNPTALTGAYPGWSFDGGDYLQSAAISLDSTKDYTILVAFSTSNAGVQYLFDIRDGAAHGLLCYMVGGVVYFGGDSGAASIRVATVGTYHDGAPHFFAMEAKVSGASTIYSIRVDGGEEAVAATKTTFTSASAAVNLAQRYTSANRFVGNIYQFGLCDAIPKDSFCDAYFQQIRGALGI